MNISKIFIVRPVMTTLVMLSILFAGILAYQKLPVSDLPNVDHPTIWIYTSYKGASAEVTANLITKELEKELNGVAGLKDLRSRTTPGASHITMEFDLAHPMSKARQDVQMAIERAQLPPDLPTRPFWREENPSEEPILYMVATSPSLGLADVYSYADRYVAQGLSSVPGISQVEVWGAERSLRVRLDPETLAIHRLSVGDVKNAIAQAAPHIPAGTFKSDHLSLAITVKEQIRGVEELENIVLKEKEGQILLLSDVAKIHEDTEERFAELKYLETDQTRNAVILAVRKQPGANVSRALADVRALLPNLLERLPDSIDISIDYDKSEFVDQSIREVQETLILAVILVVLVIFVSVGSLKETFIPSITIPLSIVITFVVMHFLGYSLNVLTLLALTLAIGFVVDDAIVVMENILRHKEEGEAPLMAALEGAKQVGFTIVAMTLSLVAVFIPLIFMEGILGKLFREFSITLAVAILASGFVAVTLTPMLCRWIPLETGAQKPRFQILAEKLQTFSLEMYKPMLQWVLKHHKTTLFAGVLSVLLTVALFNWVPVDFLPMEDTGYIEGWMATEEGSSKGKTSALLEKVTAILIEHPAVESIMSGTPNDNGAFMFISLVPHADRAPVMQVIGELNAGVADIPGKQLFIRPKPFLNLSVGDSSRGDYQYVVKSFQLENLYTGAKALKDRMEASPTFTQTRLSVGLNRRDLHLDIREDVVAQLGVRPQEIVQTLNLGYSKVKAAKILTETSEVPVFLDLQSEFKRGLDSMDQLYIRSPKTKQMVPVSDLVTVEEHIGPAAIEHLNLFPSVVIHFNLTEGNTLADAMDELRLLSKETLPEGVTGGLEGAGEVVQQYSNNMVWLMVAAVLAMYVVLGILYESFVHPLTILSTIPFAFLGAALTLLLFQQPLSLYAFIGIILLIGIVKKNGIMIVDYTLENLRSGGKSPREAVYEACLVRFRPIMMTTTSAILGAVPIAIGHGSATAARSTLGLVIIGGLVFSQLLTLLFTPVLYLQFQKLQERWQFKD